MQNGGLRTRGITKTSTPEHPLITVVTVVFNGEATLEHTIQSVVNQTYDNVEYIVVDGNSTDRTLDIIKKYEDKIDYWQSEPDKGIYDAMNKGIELANGDWINFMNSGDSFYNTEVISNIVKLFSPGNSYFGDYFDLSQKKILKQNKQKDVLLSNINHQTIFYYLNLLKANKFNLSYKILSDWYTNLKLFKLKKFIYIDYIIANYEGMGISITRRDDFFYKNYWSNIFKLYGFTSIFKVFFRRLFRKLIYLLKTK